MSRGRELLPTGPVSAEREEWLARVDAVAPLIEENRRRSDEDRATPAPVIDALRAAGVHRMWVSAEFGGGHVSLATGAAVVRALARLDPSVAWQVGVQGAVARLGDYLPEATARKLFHDNDRLVVGGVNPSGTAEVVDGGFRLSGRWAFASGYAHADWLVCTAVVTDNGAPRTGATGRETRMLFIPKSESRVLDTWHTLGLRGTGSNDFTVTETFVPDEFTVAVADLLAPPPARHSRGYPIGFYDFAPFDSAATALGVAQDALAAFRELAVAKTPAAGTTTLASSHTAQERFARAQMLVRSAEVLLEEAAQAATEHGEDGGDDLSALVRVTAATVAENSVAAVDALYRLAGSSSLYKTSRLEQCFRDVNSASKHVTVSSSHFETVGQYLLGGPLLMRR